MRILLISLWSISDTSIGGTEKFVIELARLLSKRHFVTILSLGDVDLNIKNVNIHSLNVIKNFNEYSLLKYVKNNGISNIKNKVNLFIKNNEFDVVHSNSLIFANLINETPVIHTVHTNSEELKQAFPQDIVRKILKNIKNDNNSAYVVPSQYAKKSFDRLTKKSSLVINHCFSSRILLKNKEFLRRKYKISNGEIVFCVPSRLEIKQKGQETLLKALRNVRNIFSPLAVVLGGCDAQYFKNKEYLYKNYPDFKMVISGFSDKCDMYSLSDVIVLPSKTESFGYAALESARTGFPVFLSDIPPYREIATSNNRIHLFENTEAGLAKVLKKNRDEIFNHKITTPQKNWRNKYSEALMLKKYTFLYKTCIRNFQHK